MNCIVSNNEHAFIYLLFKHEASLRVLDAQANTLLHLCAEHNAINIALILKHLHAVDMKEELSKSKMEELKQISEKSKELADIGSPAIKLYPKSEVSNSDPESENPFSLKVHEADVPEESDLESDLESEFGETSYNGYFDVNGSNM